MHFTYRYSYHQNEVLLDLKKNKDKNFVLAIWHQNLLSGILAQTGKAHVVIISKSRDADPVAYACKKLGHIIMRGSSKKGEVDKGGKLAKDEMIESLKKGIPGAVTVDGPKGPVFLVKPGIIDMAKKANVVIVPYAIGLSSYWQFCSWDQFRLPKPFSKILISYGEPIDVSDESIEFCDYQKSIEVALREQCLIAEKKIIGTEHFSRLNWYCS